MPTRYANETGSEDCGVICNTPIILLIIMRCLKRVLAITHKKKKTIKVSSE